MATVALTGLTKRFGDIVAVDRVTLAIEDGELLALLGPSGCGKTTTLRMIAGFMPPSEGEIRVGERVLSSPHHVVPPERRQMSMIFQSYAIWPHMTVFENVAYGLRLRRLGRDQVRTRVRDVLGVVHLGALADRYPAELSGGQQQRVALARALVIKPEILLLDEPLSNLDANLREEMRFEVRRLHDEFRITSVYVTHDQAEAMVTADRIAVMNAGRVEQVGTPEEVYDRPRTRFVANFLGASNTLEGRVEGDRVVVAGVALVVDPAEVRQAGGPRVAVAIRLHTIELLGRDSAAANGVNVLAGHVRRQTYLGDSCDYVIELEGSPATVRVVTRPSVRYEAGAKVLLRLPPEHCRVLAAEEDHGR